MRIGEDHIRQELEKTLDALEIRGASKEKLMEYLDPDKPGDESLLEGLEQVDFGRRADQRTYIIRGAILSRPCSTIF